jgi:hypothetical protein
VVITRPLRVLVHLTERSMPTITRFATAVTFLIGFGFSTQAWAADLCKAIALRDTPDVKAGLSDILSRGAYIDAVAEYVVNKHTGMTSFCQHGGGCYSVYININGTKVEAIRLVNCKIGQRVVDECGHAPRQGRRSCARGLHRAHFRQVPQKYETEADLMP